MSSARRLLGPDGPFASASGYEVRTGQLDMAEAVEAALGEGRVLLCEAGTGTGKTFAYLVPALLSGKKVIVSTATRALQDQIYARDLPRVLDALGIAPRVALLKGLGNYLCLRRFEQFRSGGRTGDARVAALLESWREETETGDIAELVTISEDHPALREVVSSSDTRVGPRCGHFDDCFVTAAKRASEAAQLVVVNHHLFFADLALRGTHPARVLPEYDAVIFDEAHQLEDIATTFFGTRVSSRRIELMLRDVERALATVGEADPLLARSGGPALIGDARESAERFWAAARTAAPNAGERSPLDRDAWAGELARAWHRFDDALAALASACDALAGRVAERAELARGGGAEALELASRRSSQMRDDLAAIADTAPGRVTWLDPAPKNPSVGCSVIDLSETFRELVFDAVPACVLTSATLTSTSTRGGGSAGPFAYLRGRLGLNATVADVDERVVPSPFDFAEHCLLYSPTDMPDPRDGRFTGKVIERVHELVELSDGGAFVLTTSLRAMRAIGSGLRERTPERSIAVQGDAPKAALLARFRSDPRSVLVATMSFWEGVDVPGDALRLVVLEKIPFAVPSDPIVRARSTAIEEGGGNAFMELHVPAAAITLKQGFGRLVRTGSDYGVVAVLDDRLHRKGYGKRLLSALPPAERTDSLDAVRAFWEERRSS